MLRCESSLPTAAAGYASDEGTTIPASTRVCAPLRRSGWGHVALTGAALSVLACTPDAGVPLLARDTAGVEVVNNERPTWDSSSSWRVADQPTLVLGESGGADSTTIFFRVTAILRLDDGRIVVADRGTNAIRYFGSDGTLLRTVGRSGQGPGEFEAIGQVVRGWEETLIVGDARSGRLTIVDTAGAIVRTIRADGLRASPVGLLSSGDLVVRPVSVRVPKTQGLTRLMAGLHLMDSLGATRPLDSIPLVMSWRGDKTPPRELGYGPMGYVAVGGDYYYRAFSDDYHIEVCTPEGTVRYAIRRPWERAPVSEREKKRLTSAPTPSEASAAPPEEYPFATHHPAHGRLIVDRVGNLWVEEYRRAGELADHHSVRTDSLAMWAVFDGSGRWLGAVAIPRTLEVKEIGADYVLGIQRDSDGVERVALHALRK